jgi:hypothetical protein
VQHRVDRAVDGQAVHDVVLHQREPGRVEQVVEVVAVPRREVIDRHHVPAATEERAAQVRADETGAARHDGSRHQRPTPS